MKVSDVITCLLQHKIRRSMLLCPIASALVAPMPPCCFPNMVEAEAHANQSPLTVQYRPAALASPPPVEYPLETYQRQAQLRATSAIYPHSSPLLSSCTMLEAAPSSDTYAAVVGPARACLFIRVFTVVSPRPRRQITRPLSPPTKSTQAIF